MARFFLFMFAGAGAAVGLATLIAGQSQTQIAFGSKSEANSESNVAIYAPGRVEGAAEETEIRPQAAGRVVEVLAQQGDWVEKGEVLFRLDDLQLGQQLLLAKAVLSEAEGELQRVENGARVWERDEAAAIYRAKLAEREQAQRALERVENLRQDAVAKQEVDDHLTRVAALSAEVDAAKARADLLSAPPRPDELEIAQARVDAARAQVGLADVELDRMTVRAPAAGQVLSIETAPGECVDPLMSQPPLVMADTRRLRVRAFVEEFDAPKVEPGMKAEVTADGMSGGLSGRVAHVSPTMSAKEVWSDRPGERRDCKTREVWIDLEESSKLVVGLRVDVMLRPAEIVPPPSAPSANPDSAPQLSAAAAGNSLSQR